jgi:hypothetical protein
MYALRGVSTVFLFSFCGRVRGCAGRENQETGKRLGTVGKVETSVFLSTISSTYADYVAASCLAESANHPLIGGRLSIAAQAYFAMKARNLRNRPAAAVLTLCHHVASRATCRAICACMILAACAPVKAGSHRTSPAVMK